MDFDAEEDDDDDEDANVEDLAAELEDDEEEDEDFLRQEELLQDFVVGVCLLSSRLEEDFKADLMGVPLRLLAALLADDVGKFVGGVAPLQERERDDREKASKARRREEVERRCRREKLERAKDFRSLLNEEHFRMSSEFSLLSTSALSMLSLES